VILLGNIFNTAIFAILQLMAKFLQRVLKAAPKLFYKFVSSYGLATIFDFALVGALDLFLLVFFFFTRIMNKE